MSLGVVDVELRERCRVGVGLGGRVLAPEAGIVAVIRKKNQAESSCWGRIEVCWLDGK